MKHLRPIIKELEEAMERMAPHKQRIAALALAKYAINEMVPAFTQDNDTLFQLAYDLSSGRRGAIWWERATTFIQRSKAPAANLAFQMLNIHTGDPEGLRAAAVALLTDVVGHRSEKDFSERLKQFATDGVPRNISTKQWDQDQIAHASEVVKSLLAHVNKPSSNS